MGAISRGLRNVYRNKFRTLLVIILLSVIIGIFVTMTQVNTAAKEQLGDLESKIETTIEVRPIGSLGSGGLREKPLPFDTIEKIEEVPDILKIEKYILAREIDETKENPFAIAIGLEPDSEMRVVGEAEPESLAMIAGRKLSRGDANKNVAVVGRVFAEQRVINPSELDGSAIVILNNTEFDVVGIYQTGNDFADNQVFIPFDAAKRVYNATGMSKIFVTVNSIENTDKVTQELKKVIASADVLTNVEEIATVRGSLANIRATSLFGLVFFFIIASALVVYAMILATRERVREIGTLKALGASNSNIAIQFAAESAVLTIIAGFGGVIVYFISQTLLQSTFTNIEFGIATGLSLRAFLTIALTCIVLAIIGSLYPVIKAIRLNPVEAMRYE